MDFQFSFIAAYGIIYFIIAAYCLVLLLRISSDVGRDLEVGFFRRMLLAMVVYCLVEAVWAVGNFGYSPLINRFNVELSVVNHLMIMLICYYWFCYVEAHLHSRVVDQRSLRVASAVPLLAAMAVVVSTVWTGWVFAMDTQGNVQRGMLYLPVLLVTYGYPVVATVRVVHAGRRATLPSERRALIVMSMFAIPPALAGLLDTLVPMLPIVAPAFFSSFLVIFTTLQDAQISHDALTGLNNRRRAERFFDEELAHASKANPFYYLVIDGDQFKAVNDTYGHLEGDNALCTIAEAIKQACSTRNVLAARWGGDEFVVLGLAEDVGDAEQMAATVKECLASQCRQRGLLYPLSVSVGYACSDGQNLSKRELIDAADQMLYEVKQASRTPHSAQ